MQREPAGLLGALAIDRVGAAVSLDPDGGRSIAPDQAGTPTGARAAGPLAGDRLHLQATLFAEDRSGWRISTERPDLAITCRRAGPAAIWKRYSGPPLPPDPDERQRVLDDYRLQTQDIEDAINQLLGRDPEQQAPPRLGWPPLIAALVREGYEVDEQTLIAAPFIFEFSSELLVALQRPEADG